MNSRLDWLVLSDYYSIYVTNASAKDGSAWGRTRKGLTEAVKPFSYAPLTFAVICYSFGKAK